MLFQYIKPPLPPGEGEPEIKNDSHFSGERPGSGRLGRGIQTGSKSGKDAGEKLANKVKSYQVNKILQSSISQPHSQFLNTASLALSLRKGMKCSG